MTAAYVPQAISATQLGVGETPPKPLIGPITEASQGMLFGPMGIGKTLLAIELGLGLASGDSRLRHPTAALPPQWPVSQVCPVLYVAGEMNDTELDKRMKLGGVRKHDDRLRVLSNSRLWRSTRRLMNIAKRETQDMLHAEAVAMGARLVILDNLDTLCAGINENDKTALEPLNRWLLSLRYDGIAVLQVHHVSYRGNPRGSTVRGTPLDYQIALTAAQAGDPLLDQSRAAHFTVSFTKVRENMGRLVRPFSMRLNGSGEAAQWEFRSILEAKETQLLDIMEATQLFEWRPIAEEMAISRSTLYILRNRLAERGLWVWGKSPSKSRFKKST